jgi:hypothetical protein
VVPGTAQYAEWDLRQAGRRRDDSACIESGPVRDRNSRVEKRPGVPGLFYGVVFLRPLAFPGVSLFLHGEGQLPDTLDPHWPPAFLR